MLKKSKKFFILSLITTFFLLIHTNPTSAAQCSGVETSLINCEGGGDAGIWHILLLIIDILTIGIGITAVIGIMIFGIQYLTAGGNTDKITKAKRRMLEIIIGIVVWVVLYSLAQWLMPGGRFSGVKDDIQSISISADKTTIYNGTSIKPTITFNPQNPEDKTYSLTTSDASIVGVVGNTIRCKSTGKATVTAISANGKTSSIEITCEKPPEPEPTKTDPGSDTNPSPGSGPQPENTWFKCDNCPSNGSSISQAKSTSFNKAYSNDEGSITYEKTKQLAKNKGISENNFYAIVAWARTENYENHGYGNYFAYLCISTMVNKALSGENLISQMNAWAKSAPNQIWFYSYAKFLGSHDSSHCQRDEIYGTGQTVCGYYNSNLKMAYMALKYTYPKVNSCYGGRPNNVVANQGGIYVGW